MLYKVRAWPLQGMAEEKVLLPRRESIARGIWKRPEHRQKVVHSMICVSRGGLERTVGEDQGRRGQEKGGKERGGTRREGEKVEEGSLELEHMAKMTGLYGKKKLGEGKRMSWRSLGQQAGWRSVEKRSHRWNEPGAHHTLGFAHRHHS